MKEYNKPARITPSCVILWDRGQHLGDAPGYLFSTAVEAKDHWRQHSGRRVKEADIQRIEATSKAGMLRQIQSLLIGEHNGH